MANGNVSVQTSGGGSTLGVIAVSGNGVSFLSPLYRYANLTLPFSPNDPGLSFVYDNSSLAPTVLLYARFFNLLNEASSAVVVNVGTSAFAVSGAGDCLDVRSFGAVGDGVADDTVAIQAALDKAHQNYLGNKKAGSGILAATSQPVQSTTAFAADTSPTQLQLVLPVAPTVGNTFVLSFFAFHYGDVGSPATPTVTDNRGNVWKQASPPAINGENLLYTFYAPVGSALSTTVTIQLSQVRFNSCIAAVLTEFTGVLLPIVGDGIAAVLVPNGFFVAPSLPSSSQADLVIYSVEFGFAAGTTPVPPSDFTLVGAQAIPQPNDLNGSVPVVAQAYKNWAGKPAINSNWSSPSGGYGGGASLVAFRLQPLAPTPPGITKVCIPNGVNCMISPLPIFDHDLGGAPWTSFPNSNFRYGPMYYSLVVNDGVTFEINGSLIANPNATSSFISGVPTGWVLITNSAWLQNTVISTQLINPVLPGSVLPWNRYLDGSAFNEGPRNTGINIGGVGKVYLNGETQANLPELGGGGPHGFSPMGFARFFCVDSSSIDGSNGLELLNPYGLAIQWGNSTAAKIINLYIHDAPNFAGVKSDTGIIEMNMLRNSKVTGNKIVNCPKSYGLIDFAGYQNMVSGNTFDGCYGGYQYYDKGGEWAWIFGLPNVGGSPGSEKFAPTYQGQTYTNVTHNSEITQNTAVRCTTAAQSIQTHPQSSGLLTVILDNGSDGFGFNAGIGTLTVGANGSVMGALPVLGTSFHDNTANGNSTDIFYGPLMAFKTLAGNTFTTSSGLATSSASTAVANSLNTVVNELPLGIINGANSTFTLAHAPIAGAGTLNVYINGLLEKEGTDFTVSGNNIVFVVAPNPGSTVFVSYQYLSGN